MKLQNMQNFLFFPLLAILLFSVNKGAYKHSFTLDGWEIETPAPTFAREMDAAAELGLWKQEGTLSESERAQMAYFVANMKNAVASKLAYGTPIAIKLAQGVLESDKGESYLAREAKNHFGVKSWKTAEKRVQRCDDSCKDYFRVYNSVEQSYLDHDRILLLPRYANLWKNPATDYKAWAKGLQKAGYATSKTYSKKLITLIEKYSLNLLDEMSDIELYILLQVFEDLNG